MNLRRLLTGGLLTLGLLAGTALAPSASAAPADPASAAAAPVAPDTDGAAPVPAWTGPVMDLAGALTPDQIRTLTGQVQALEQAHGSQLFVLLVPGTGSDSIEQYARRVFDQWAVGRQGVDDGVLLLVALQERRLRIEVGYGLEGAVTDVDAGRIIRERITPRFAEGDVFGGLEAGVSALSDLIAGEPLPPPESSSEDDDDDGALVMLLGLGFMTLVMPPLLSALLMGGFALLLSESLLWAGLGALAGLALGVLGRVLHIADRLPRGGGGGSSGGGFGGGFGGGGFGGGGGGSSGGGGGRGGGGGASGGW